MNDTYPKTESECLAEFFQAFSASLDPRLWIKLIEEETREFQDELNKECMDCVTKAALLKEAADVMYVTMGWMVLMDDAGNLYDWLVPQDELLEWRLAIHEANSSLKQATAIFGADLLRTAFYRVHRSNMSKLDEYGMPIRREDGKILKGPNYEAPDLSDLV